MTQSQVTFPVAGVTIGADGVSMTVDEMLATPTFINEQIAELIVANQGFYAHRLLKMPGMTVSGGAILYREVNATDVLFLDDEGNFAPRAPGAESPQLELSRRDWKVAREESMSLAWEIVDEVRRTNNTIEASDVIQATANSFVDRMNTRALTLINAYLDATATRDIDSTDWAQAWATGTTDVEPRDLPARDFRKAKTMLINDKTGNADAELILIGVPEDIEHLDMIYGDKLEKILERYNIVDIIESPHAASGKPLIAVEGGLGYTAFSKELDTEEDRGKPGTWTTHYGTEACPVFVVNKAINCVRLDLAEV